MKLEHVSFSASKAPESTLRCPMKVVQVRLSAGPVKLVEASLCTRKDLESNFH